MIRIPFTKAIIVKHLKGKWWYARIAKAEHPVSATIIVLGRFVFYSNLEIVPYLAERYIKKQKEGTK